MLAIRNLRYFNCDLSFVSGNDSDYEISKFHAKDAKKDAEERKVWFRNLGGSLCALCMNLFCSSSTVAWPNG